MLMPVTRINNVNLYYEICGKGPDLILLGGLSTNHTAWSLMLPNLAKHFCVMMLDNRGSGKSSQSEGSYTIDDMAEDIAQLMEFCGIHSAFIAGHSMGGSIAQKLCIKHPDKVKAAVIAGSTAKLPKTAQMQIETTTKLIDAGLSQKLILETIFPWIYGNSFLEIPMNIEKELNYKKSEPYPQTYEGYIGQVNALRSYDTLNQLEKIKCPILVLVGEEDLLTPIQCSKVIANSIPHACLKILTRCGHMIHREQPKEFNKHIISFLKDTAYIDQL